MADAPGAGRFAKARRFPFEQRILLFAIVLAALALTGGIGLIWRLDLPGIWRGVLIVAWGLILLGLCAALHRAAVAPLRGLTNVVESYRGGDYTLRSSREQPGDALGDLVHEINSLGDTLHQQRLRALEATALLDKLIGAIDVAVLAFDGERKVRLLNAAATRLLGLESGEGPGCTATDLALESFLTDAIHTRTVTSIAGREGRWQVMHGTFRESGQAQHLLVISDVRQALREEERIAWRRLIRVIGHEVNNSLAPIQSLVDTFQELLGASLAPGPAREDVLSGLKVIADRTKALGRFLAQYGRLARLPQPRRRWVRLAPLIARVAALAPLQRIETEAVDDLEAYVDEDQLEQALINLARNAVEAQGDGGGRVTVTAQNRGAALAIAVMDEGPGIANPDNLFVPFFTTKPGGSGVGLVLSRQIAEAHGGTLTLANRRDARGARAMLELPGAARRLPSVAGPG